MKAFQSLDYERTFPETRCAHYIIYLCFYNNNWVDISAGELLVTTRVLTWFINSTCIYIHTGNLQLLNNVLILNLR